jgi:hypothetical protein
MVGQAQPYYGIDQDINSCNGFSFAGLYFDENICPIKTPNVKTNWGFFI